MTRISAIGIALLCILCVTSCGLKSRQTTTESSSETGYSPVTTDTAATIVPCYAKGYTVKYLPQPCPSGGYTRPSKRSSSTFHYALVPKGIKPVGIPSDYTVIETPVEHVMCMTSLQLSNFIRLDACDYVVGITSTRHLFNKEMNDRLKSGETVKIGIEGNFDNEVIMSMNPDVIFISPFKRGGYDAMREIGIPLVPHLGYKEMTPLGQAEWIKFIGMFIGQEVEANEKVCCDREAL